MEQYKNNSIFPFRSKQQIMEGDKTEFFDVEFTHIFGKILPGQKFSRVFVNYAEGWFATYNSQLEELNRIKFICKVD